MLRNGQYVGEYLTRRARPHRAHLEDDRQGARRCSRSIDSERRGTRDRPHRGAAALGDGHRTEGLDRADRPRAPPRRGRRLRRPARLRAAPSSPACSTAPTAPTPGTVELDGDEVDAQHRRPPGCRTRIAFSSENRRDEGIIARPHRPREPGPRRPGQARLDAPAVHDASRTRSSTKYIAELDVRPADPETPDQEPLRRQPAEGAARPLAGHEARAPDPRRADPRHRRRRQGRDPGSRRRPRATTASRSSSSPPSSTRSSASATAIVVLKDRRKIGEIDDRTRRRPRRPSSPSSPGRARRDDRRRRVDDVTPRRSRHERRDADRARLGRPSLVRSPALLGGGRHRRPAAASTSIKDPGYLSITVQLDTGAFVGNLIDILRAAAPILMIATGMCLVIATGGIDLSVGSMMAVAGAVVDGVPAATPALPTRRRGRSPRSCSRSLVARRPRRRQRRARLGRRACSPSSARSS